MTSFDIKRKQKYRISKQFTYSDTVFTVTDIDSFRVVLTSTDGVTKSYAMDYFMRQLNEGGIWLQTPYIDNYSIF